MANTVNKLKNFFNTHQIILAPMAGINDVVFRRLCIEQGAQLTYTEMVSTKGLSYKNERTQGLLALASNEEEVVVQLFGNDPHVFAKEVNDVAARLGSKLAYIDINMACPARKIVKKGDGAALMQNPKLATEIISACVQSTDVPITVKTRLGFNMGDDTYVSFAQACQKAGASAVALHGRYAMQYYKGEANWGAVSRLSKEVAIPVIGSGDITSASIAQERIKQSGAQAVMIGRAAIGNPQIFAEVAGKRTTPVRALERMETAMRHVSLFAGIEGVNLAHMRVHCMKYIRGLAGASVARERISYCQTVDDYREVFEWLVDVNSGAL